MLRVSSCSSEKRKNPFRSRLPHSGTSVVIRVLTPNNLTYKPKVLLRRCFVGVKCSVVSSEINFKCNLIATNSKRKSKWGISSLLAAAKVWQRVCSPKDLCVCGDYVNLTVQINMCPKSVWGAKEPADESSR